ncbi:MAG: carbohydrate kinase, partial [Saprospiraceae bacterium]|nr:carbohydrate kinase [Saprospiraceae bacterium]
NTSPGGSMHYLDFNRHTQAHLFRAGLEGIAFAFAHGFAILRDLGLDPEVIRVGNDNLFRSTIFSQTVAHLLQCSIQVYATTGAVGAAHASAKGEQADITGTSPAEVYEPGPDATPYQAAFERWSQVLSKT